MRTLKNSCNNGNRSARSVFVVSWNLLLTRAGFFFCRLEIFIAYWHLLIISLKCYLFSRGCVFWSRRGWVKETALLSTSSLDLAAACRCMFLSKKETINRTPEKNPCTWEDIFERHEFAWIQLFVKTDRSFRRKCLHLMVWKFFKKYLPSESVLCQAIYRI